jgi:CheY-like chemotaxis protein
MIDEKLILIVEDTWQVRNLLAKVVKHVFSDYTVETADNGQEALAVVDDRVPRLVITDLDMPEMDGYGLIAGLHERGVADEMSIIIVTSLADRIEDMHIKRRLREMGLPTYPIVCKPLDMDDFRRKVSRALE